MTAERKPDAWMPCPFCGNTDIANDEGCFRSGEWWEVRCGNPSCFAHDPCDESRRAAIARWNRRAPNPAIEALIKAASFAAEKLDTVRAALASAMVSSARANSRGLMESEAALINSCRADRLRAALALWQPAAPDDNEARK